MRTIMYLTALWFVYVIVFVSVHVTNESRCLAAGYIETKTDFAFNSYCSNMSGAVTYDVVPVEELTDE